VCENPKLWEPSGAHCRSLGFLRISCQGLVASVNLVRLSLKKAAYVAVDWCRVVGNPEFAPNDTGAGRPRFSTAPTALRSYMELSPSPPGLGSRLAAGPPGLASMAISQCHFFLNLP
jgi:hypothetical protein